MKRDTNTFEGDFTMKPKSLLRDTVSRLTALAVVAAVAIGGCAMPDDIDRVQPDLLPKSMFEGEWYILDTVTRAPYASHYAFQGYQGLMERGQWEIEESMIYFYRTYEFVEGVEEQGIKGDTDTPVLDENGDPVTYEITLADGSTATATRYMHRSNPLAIYDIKGHYDVRRQYNAVTGQESNVIVEDSSEKFWYERDHVRIDFGYDDSGNVGRFGLLKMLKGKVALYQGENGPEDMKFRVEDDGTYMDFVTTHYMEAPTIYLSYYGWIPTCLFYPWYTGSYYECDVEELRVRTSFMKVDPNNTYQGWNYDDHNMNKFGYFRVGRAHWDELYGQTYGEIDQHATRYNVWQEWINAEDGSVDYANMTPDPIIYYLSEEFPRELIPGSLDLADQWNGLFMELVETLMGKDHSDGVKDRMFVMCENNMHEVAAVLEADPNAILAETDERYCKDMHAPKQIGDLRYNLLVSVTEPTQFGLGGYGPMNSDPLTGETIMANAFLYTGNIRLGARNAVDMIEYAAGVQNFRDVAQAQHITTSIKAKKLAITQGAPRSSSFTEEMAIEMADDVLMPSVAANLTDMGLPETDLDLARVGMAPLEHADDMSWAWLHDEMSTLAGIPVTDLQAINDDGLLGSITHPMNIGDESLLHWEHSQDVDHAHRAICMMESFDDSFSGLADEYKSIYDKAVCEGLQDRPELIFDFTEFSDPGAYCGDDASVCLDDQICTSLSQGEVNGKYCITPCSTNALLQQLRDEIRRVNQIDQFVYWDPNALYSDVKDEEVMASQIAARDLIEVVREEVFNEVFDRYWSTIALHEVGHNVGLRHNFESSTDALNYFSGYWDIKGFTDDGGEWHPHERWNAFTDDQVRGRLSEYQQTTVMEYSGAFNARYMGLGSYDRAAILYGYGRLVDVFSNTPDWGAIEPYVVEPEFESPTEFGLVGRRESPMGKALRKVHHTNYPELFGGVDNIVDRATVPVDSLILTHEVTPSAEQLCGEQDGKVFPYLYCELALDIAEICEVDGDCADGKGCQLGRCIYEAGSEPGVCCNTQPDHYNGPEDLEQIYYDPACEEAMAADEVDPTTQGQCVFYDYFGDFHTIGHDEPTARTERMACSAYDDPYDTSVCGGTPGSYCRPFPDGHFCSTPDVAEVPFRFCSDDYNWTSPTCQTHDEGTDPFDMITLRIEDYEAYWPFRAYKRDNDLFYPGRGYWGSVMYHFSWLRKHFEHWAYNYARYNKGDWWQNRFGTPWHQDINGGLSTTLAVREMFTHMANVFGRPSDGYYGFNVQKERYEPVIDNGANTYTHRFEVREDTGARPMYSAYDFSGYMYSPSRAGTFYDRLAALQMLTYPRMIFVRGVDTVYDWKRFRFNYASIFPTRMQNLLSGLFTSDPGSFGWCLEHDGVSPTMGGNGDPLRMKPRMWFGSPGELDDYYANCTPVTPEPEYTFPTTQYRLPAIASIYGMGWASQTYDRTFFDRTRLWLEGEGNDITVPEGYEVVTFADPFSGKTYVAPYDPTEFDPYAVIDPRETLPSTDNGYLTHNYWPAAQLVATANTLLQTYGTDDYHYSDLQQLVGRLEILRNLYRYFEY